MLITKEWLEEKGACKEGKDWFIAEGIKESVAGIKNLISKEKLDWANWLICRVFNRKQKIQYAIFAAEQVIHIFENKYPEDKRPRNAIEAAKSAIKENSRSNKAANAAYAAANAAYAAAYDAAAADAADAADAAAAAAAAAYAAAYDAAAAAYDADAADAADAANAANAADAAANRQLKIKTLKYGIILLEGKC